MIFVVRSKEAALVETVLKQAFVDELKRKSIQRIYRQDGYGLVAVIGKHMLETPGIAACLFGALIRRNINVKMIVQGISDLSLSIVVTEEQLKNTLNALHNAFFLPDRREASIFLVGLGMIGTELLTQLAKLQTYDTQKRATRFVLKGIANSRKMCLASEGIPFERAADRLAVADSCDLLAFVEGIKNMQAEGSLFVDCTSSDKVVELYTLLLRLGIPVVTPNKRGFSGSMSQYKKIQKTAATHFTTFFYETTVGAGLPVLSTLRDLRASGDRILKIEGVLSGTFSYIFNQFNQGANFFQLLEKAQAKGLTEPDPREDLKGTDVVRKLLILVREAGYALEMENISLTSCLPSYLFKEKSLSNFYKGLREYIPQLEQQRETARASGKRLCFLAGFEAPKKAWIRLSTVSETHPCYSLSGEENVVIFTTSRYSSQSLIVRGPGAGASVTAAGLLADIIKASDTAATHYYPFRNLT